MSTKLRVVQPEEPNEPIDKYIKEVEGGTKNTLPYERLMIWYRRHKMYAEEINVISKGISMLKSFYADQQKQALGRRINPSVKALSAKINKSTGLHDKKGNDLFLPEPMGKWQKRKVVAEAKLKKASKPPTKTPGKRKRNKKRD